MHYAQRVGTPRILSPPTLFGNGDSTNRRWKVAARAHPIPDLVEVALQIGVELLDRLPIHAGRTSLDLTALYASYTCRFSILNGLFVVSVDVILSPVVPQTRPPDPPPSLQPHYRAFIATTGRSAPVPCFGTLASRFWPLVLLPWHQETGSCSSAQKPVSSSRPLYAGRRPLSHQAPRGLVPGEKSAPDFDDT